MWDLKTELCQTYGHGYYSHVKTMGWTTDKIKKNLLQDRWKQLFAKSQGFNFKALFETDRLIEVMFVIKRIY